MTGSRFLAGCLVVGTLSLGPAIGAESAPPSLNAQHQFIGARGLALYTFDTDGHAGKSQCTGPCARIWPPYAATAGVQASNGFSVVTRPDHSLQWAFKGQPLYRYAGDTKPGDHHGDGINGTWHIAREH